MIPARDLKKADELKEVIREESPKAEIVIFETDVSSFVSVRRFCSGFLALGLPLTSSCEYSLALSYFCDQQVHEDKVLENSY